MEEVYVVVQVDCNGYACQTWVPTNLASKMQISNAIGRMTVVQTNSAITLDSNADQAIMPYPNLVGCTCKGDRVKIIATY